MVDEPRRTRANTAAVTRAIFIVFSLGYLKRGSSTWRGRPDTHPCRASTEGRAVRVTTGDQGHRMCDIAVTSPGGRGDGRGGFFTAPLKPPMPAPAHAMEVVPA